jgi:hypothetical protein
VLLHVGRESGVDALTVAAHVEQGHLIANEVSQRDPKRAQACTALRLKPQGRHTQEHTLPCQIRGSRERLGREVLRIFEKINEVQLKLHLRLHLWPRQKA